LRKPEETERIIRRLGYLCQLIRRARRPLCSLNGMLVVLPLDATASKVTAGHVASELFRAVSTVHATLQVHCPIVLLCCEMEALEGFRELLALLPENQRRRLLGQPFPLAADVPPDGVADMLADGLRWTIQTTLPALVYRLMRVEPHNGDGARDSTETARRLYNLLHSLWEREGHICQVLTRLADAQGPGLPLVGGCYFAATGADPVREQGFVPAVFAQLVAGQDAVAWTEAARREDAAFRRWTRYGYAAIGLFVVSLAVAGYFVYLR
jgi:type VI protein secretion system component VasK